MQGEANDYNKPLDGHSNGRAADTGILVAELEARTVLRTNSGTSSGEWRGIEGYQNRRKQAFLPLHAPIHPWSLVSNPAAPTTNIDSVTPAMGAINFRR